MTEIEKLEVEIKTLQKKLELLKEIETHKSQPKMEFDFGGKFEVVSYNDKKYYRLEYPISVGWCMRKEDDNGAILLKQITDGETHRLLEGLWFNEVKGGKYDEPDCPDEPYRNVRAYWDKKDNLKPTTLYEIIADWWDEIFLNNNEAAETIESLVDRIEKEWLPKEQSAAGSQNAYVECSVEGFNDCLTKIKGKLR